MRSLLHRALHTPRQTLARRVTFQVHLWAGLVLGLYASLIGLSGSALVFRPEIEQLLRPRLYTLAPLTPVSATASPMPATPPPGLPRPTLDQLLSTAQTAFPHWQPLGLEQLPATPTAAATQPVLLYMVSRPGDSHLAPHSFTPDQLLVYLDPRTGTLLGARSRYAGVLGWAANLHYYLLAGDRGYLVNGLLALAFLVVCLTGWVVWWPGVRRLGSAIRIHGLVRVLRGRPNWRRLNWDLHSTGGFWSNPALLALILTGVFFVFPQATLRVIATLTHTDPAVIHTWYSEPSPVVPPPGSHPVAVQTVWQAAIAALPAGTPVGYLGLSANPGAPSEAIAYRPRTAPYAQPVRVFVDPTTGRVTQTLDSRTLPPALRAVLYVYAVHFGSFAGLISRLLWFLFGLAPAALVVTGVILWCRRWLRPRLAARQKANRIAYRMTAGD